MKYIGIVGRVKNVDEQESWIGVNDTYRKILAQYPDVIPILILPYKDIWYGEICSQKEREEGASSNQKLEELLELCDGFLLPGGNRWYSYDEYIIEYALKKDKPIFGICLGFQTMALVDNKLNSNIFDFTTKVESTINHNQLETPYAHDIIIKEGSRLEEILGVSRCKVNSRHNYQVLELTNFVVSAYSEDHIIEAIEYPGKCFAIGVQWHPESMVEYDPLMKKIFDAFIQAVEQKISEKEVL